MHLRMLTGDFSVENLNVVDGFSTNGNDITVNTVVSVRCLSIGDTKAWHDGYQLLVNCSVEKALSSYCSQSLFAGGLVLAGVLRLATGA